MNNNHACLVCLGSNKEGKFHLVNAQHALTQLFHKVQMGNVVITKAEGNIPQPDYLNQAARFMTDLSPEKVEVLLKKIEKDNGRTCEDKRLGSVPLDIDLLMYDEKILRPADLNKEYVKSALLSLPKTNFQV